MSDLQALPKLAAFYGPAERGRIYGVLSVFLEAGLAADDAVEALAAAVETDKADNAARALADPVRRLAAHRAQGKPLGDALLSAFGRMSAEETAILSVLGNVGDPAAARMLQRAADIAASLKSAR